MPIAPARNHAARHDGDALSALLDTERALRERLDAAAEEARRIVDAARARASSEAHDLDASIARALAALDATHERALQEELTQIADRARADRARFEGVDRDRIRELAARVVQRLVRA